MINVARELEAREAAGAIAAELRFADPEVRTQLRLRIARAKRRANLIIALVVAAIIGVSAGAWAMPRDQSPVPPAPNPSATETAHAGRLPALGTQGYLVSLRAAHHTYEALTCSVIPDTALAADEVDYPGTMPPLPTWIEADRIYGIDNGLPSSYPIPLYARDGTMFYELARSQISQLYPAGVEVVVALIAPDGSWWGFSAEYLEVDAMPFDAPGVFVRLTPNEDCHGGPRAVDRSRIPAGHYEARVMAVRNDNRLGNVITDYGDVEIVTGLPSIPSLNVPG